MILTKFEPWEAEMPLYRVRIRYRDRDGARRIQGNVRLRVRAGSEDEALEKALDRASTTTCWQDVLDTEVEELEQTDQEIHSGGS